MSKMMEKKNQTMDKKIKTMEKLKEKQETDRL